MCRTHGRNPIFWAGPEHHFIGGPSLAALARQPLEPRNRSGIEDPDAVGEWRWDGRYEEI